jgi:threonine 3-dehydrogenase
VHIYEWDPWSAGRVKPPIIFGHELGGVVEDIGGEVTCVRRGDLVSVETHIVCGTCYQCRTGEAHVCDRVSILGIDRDGAFAELVVVPEANVWVNSPSLAPEVAAIQEPLGNAVHSVLSGPITGCQVAVFGCGPIGLWSVAVARAAGAVAVYAVEPSEYRRELAMRMGATRVLNPLDADVVSRIREFTGNVGADVVLEMSGNASAIRDGLRVGRNGARVSLLGLPPRPLELDVSNDIVLRGLTVQGIAGRRMYATWFQTGNLVNTGLINPAVAITHRFPLEDFAEAFAVVKSGMCGKVVLHP